MKYLFFLFNITLFFIMTSSCGTNEKKHTDNTISKVDFEIVKTGILHGAGEEGFSQSAVRVSNREKFDELRNQMNSVNNEIEDDITEGESFFSEHMLIFVFDKVRGTGGYTFEVSEIINNHDTLTVKVLSKPPTGPATSIMTQPFQIVKLEKTDQKVKLEIIG